MLGFIDGQCLDRTDFSQFAHDQLARELDAMQKWHVKDSLLWRLPMATVA